jgi:SAM-dependent methyltransferase
MSVLDVGCGTGAITKGIADAVGPTGLVVGVDRDPGLIERARVRYAPVAHLRFEARDALRIDHASQFDVVTAARALQWIAEPALVVRQMARAARPGGLVVVLDYNHTLNTWEPAPPREFASVYTAFLAWRQSNGWDNDIANRCHALFEEAGLLDIRSSIQNEITLKGDDDFLEKSALWTQVIENLGPALHHAGVCGTEQLEAARRSYDSWRRTDLQRQTLAMGATVARVPASLVQ